MTVQRSRGMRMDWRFAAMVTGAALLLGALSGCATASSAGPKTLREASAPAWSYDEPAGGMLVAVSPAGQTLRWAGSAGLVLGTGIDAAQNAKAKKTVLAALGSYAPSATFEENIRLALTEQSGRALQQVAPLGNKAGNQNRREAQEDRFKSLAKQGIDLVLDTEVLYGLFGPDATVAARIDAGLYRLPEGDRLWANDIIVSPEPLLVSDKLADPTKRLALLPSTSPKLKVEGDILDSLLRDNAVSLKGTLDTSFDAATRALLCDLGLLDDAVGAYYLGKLAMNRKRFEEAQAHFEKALQLDPGYIDARNGWAVNRFHMDDLAAALEGSIRLTRESPDFGPAWVNVAWMLAIEKNDPAAAQPYYARALELGQAIERKLERRMEEAAAR